MLKHFFYSAVFFTLTSCVVSKSYQDYRATCEDSGGRLLQHSCFTLWYSDDCKQPVWVAYTLHRGDLDSIAIRKDNFKPDPKIPITFSASLADYAKSGYDRGHLAPAADMKRSQNCMDESFYLSNISPQVPAQNRGVWKRLEEQVRKYAVAYDSVVVVTGALLTGEMDRLGESRMCIPNSYYKGLLIHKSGELKTLGFIVPNAASTAELSAFVVTIDELEALTNIDFFPYLSQAIQQRIESVADFNDW